MSATLEASIIRAQAGSHTVGFDQEGTKFYRSSCHKCGGQGIIPGYYYVEGGVCFACNGGGGLGAWVNAQEWEALEAKKAAASQKRAEAKARKQAREADANLQAVLAVHGQDLFEGLIYESPAFAHDIRSKAIRFGSISEAQASAVRRALAPKAPVEASEAPVTPSAGRQVLSGKVVSKKVVENAYGSTVKMLVQFEGFRLFGSVPAGLVCEAGDTVSFTATVEPKEPGFGFFSRPKA